MHEIELVDEEEKVGSARTSESISEQFHFMRDKVQCFDKNKYESLVIDRRMHVCDNPGLADNFRALFEQEDSRLFDCPFLKHPIHNMKEMNYRMHDFATYLASLKVN